MYEQLSLLDNNHSSDDQLPDTNKLFNEINNVELMKKTMSINFNKYSFIGNVKNKLVENEELYDQEYMLKPIIGSFQYDGNFKNFISIDNFEYDQNSKHITFDVNNVFSANVNYWGQINVENNKKDWSGKVMAAANVNYHLDMYLVSTTSDNNIPIISIDNSRFSMKYNAISYGINYKNIINSINDALKFVNDNKVISDEFYNQLLKYVQLLVDSYKLILNDISQYYKTSTPGTNKDNKFVIDSPYDYNYHLIYNQPFSNFYNDYSYSLTDGQYNNDQFHISSLSYILPGYGIILDRNIFNQYENSDIPYLLSYIKLTNYVIASPIFDYLDINGDKINFLS